MDWNFESALNIFNILGILIIIYNSLGIIKIVYKKNKLKKYFGDNLNTIPEKLPSRSFWNKAGIFFWGLVFLFSLVQIFSKGYLEFTPDFISTEIIALFALSFVMNKYIQKDEFAEYAMNVPVFYDDKGAVFHPQASFMDFDYFGWNYLIDHKTEKSKYYGFFDVVVTSKDGRKKKLFCGEDVKEEIENLFNKKIK